MTSIATTLRRVAYALPLLHEAYMPNQSQYICDNLEGRHSSLLFLRELGMGSGFDVFGPWQPQPAPDTDDRQARRYAWLIFAAQIAEEWGF